MSLVTVAPESVAQAAGQLESIRSALTEATAAASAPTTGVLDRPPMRSRRPSPHYSAVMPRNFKPSAPKRRRSITSSWAC
jgi:PE family protein